MTLIKHEKRATGPGEVVAWPEERFDRAFRDMFRDWFTGGALLERFFESRPNPLHLEEYIQDGTRVVRAEMPGLDPDKDVQISVADGMLTLQAHREERNSDGHAPVTLHPGDTPAAVLNLPRASPDQPEPCGGIDRIVDAVYQ